MHAPRLSRLLTCLFAAALVVPLFAFGVAGQPEPPAKAKVFYLQTSNEALNVGVITTRNFMDTTFGTNGQSVASAHQVVGRWYVFPELAGDVHVNGTVRIQVWWRAQGTAPGANVDWTLTLREIRSDGSTALIGSQAVTSPGSTAFVLGEGRVDGVNYNLPAGSSLEAHLRLFGNIATTYTIAWGNATFNSRLVLPTHDYVRPVPQGEGGIWTLDSAFNVRNVFDAAAANKTIYIRALVTDPFGGYDIARVNATVTDPTGAVVPALNDVPMAKIAGFFNTFDNVYEVSWNYSGYPEGQYNVTITALDNTGLTTGNVAGHLETASDGVFFIGTVGFVDVHILVRDGDNAPLPGALVVLLFGGVPQAASSTNASGMVAFRVPPGAYEAQVWWNDTLVGSASVSAISDIPFSDPLVINAAVFTVAFRILDSQNVPLEEAAVSVTFPNGRTTDDPLLAGANGVVSLGRVAGGSFGINVQWRGQEVADTRRTVTASGTIDISASVYYVTFRALDSTSATVAGALVTVTEPVFGVVVEAQLTGSDGELTARLPAASYEVEVQLFGITVLSGFALSVTGPATVDLDLAVHPMTITPVDERGVPLEGSTVTVTTTGFSLVGNAGTAGRVTFRLPAGTYGLVVRWMNTEVFSGSVDIAGTTTAMTVTAAVHYLGVSAVDRDGDGIANVFVTVSRDGETLAAGRTNANGTIEFRLPAGTYTVNGQLRTTEFLSEIRHSAETTATLPGPGATLPFPDFPPNPLASALFLVIVAVLVLVAIIGYILLRWKGVIK